MPETSTFTATRFHFGLTVADLAAAVRFYEILLASPPVKHREDYAKFDVADPPIVLALHPGEAASTGALNHVGFRVGDTESLIAVQQRLEAHGIHTVREDDVECCYAKQTKFWVPDADRNLWEIYTLDDDLDHSGFGGDERRVPSRPDVDAEPVVWQHMLTSPPPERIPLANETVDEVRLEGTYNANFSEGTRLALLQEAWRVLKPGGRINVHGLVSDRPYPGQPNLPGPAAMVQHIPLESAPSAELVGAGFVGLWHDKLGDIHCFQLGGVELRELRLSGFKPARSDGARTRTVMYRGPLAHVVDEQGQTFPRGQRVQVGFASWSLLRQAPFADDFTCFACADTEQPLQESHP
ncbi:MAG: ArsI/CadI family heavy metal resistance metalloenzyme [Betaproteobacteria bacterium]